MRKTGGFRGGGAPQNSNIIVGIGFKSADLCIRRNAYGRKMTLFLPGCASPPEDHHFGLLPVDDETRLNEKVLPEA